MRRNQIAAKSRMTSIGWTILIAIVGPLLSTTDAVGQKSKDIVWPTNAPMINGVVEEVTADYVSIKEKGETLSVPVDQIKKLRFGDDPKGFATIRTDVANGQIEQASTRLKKIKASGRPFVKQEVDFYKSLVTARLALKGQSDVTAAAKQMKSFLDANPNSIRYYEACEVMGDLAMNLGKFGPAASFYSRLEKSKSTGISARGTLRQGDALFLSGDTNKASQKFQQTMKSSDARLKALGEVGIANCLVADGKSDSALKQLEKVIAENNSKDTELFARAYNALGHAFEASGDLNAALDAYLHTDLLFNRHTSHHAEALYHLSKLWSVANKPGEAARARQALKQRYAASLWAKK